MMQTDPTPYADINELLEQLLVGMQKILDTKLVGLYLYGSLVTGDFDKKISDLDLLAVLSSEMNDEEFAGLQRMHDDFAQKNRSWDDRIEVAYVSVDALQTFKLHSSMIGIISPGEPFHRKEAGEKWLVNWYMVREKGITLSGPSPESLIEPMAKAEFIQAVKEHARAWEEWVQHVDTKGSQAYAILTMCRALYICKHGEQVSKKRAAAWVENAAPQWSSLIQQALLWREVRHKEEVDHDARFEETLQFVRFAISECENASDV